MLGGTCIRRHLWSWQLHSVPGNACVSGACTGDLGFEAHELDAVGSMSWPLRVMGLDSGLAIVMQFVKDVLWSRV